MKLALPTVSYLQRAEIERNRAIEQADGQNHKRNRDVEIGSARLILTAPDGSRWAVEVDNSGNLSTAAA